jgi:hypothetical protein
MKLVYICSPLRGNITVNIKKATTYCAYAAQQGVIPLAPHTMFTRFLDDTIPDQRAKGLAMGIELLKRCDEMWVCGDSISQGMGNEIEFAKQLSIPIKSLSERFFTQDMSNQVEQDETLRIKNQIQEIRQYGPILFTREGDGEVTGVILPEEAHDVLSPEECTKVEDFILHIISENYEPESAQMEEQSPEFELSH